MTLPNFLLPGAAKSGTTTLYHWLSRHPDVYLPAFKEPYFFSDYKPSKESIRDRAAYERLFEGARGQRRIGEASAGYLYCPAAPARIRELLGSEVRLVAVLRHPAERAWSMYWHRRRDAEESLCFEEALEAEPDRIAAGWQLGWHYLAMGRYRDQLERFRACFSPEQLLVLCFDDLKRDPLGTLREVTDFLDLEPFRELPRAENENRNFTIRYPALERWIRSAGSGSLGGFRRLLPAGVQRAAKHGLRRLNRVDAGYGPMPAELRRSLGERFRVDIEYLAGEGRPGFRAWAEDLR